LSVTVVTSSVLLAMGLLIVLASCTAMAIMDDPLDRLHMVTPAATLGASAICAAIVVRFGVSSTGLSAILVAVFIAGSSPFMGHAIARAILLSSGSSDGDRGEGAERRREEP
jgi:multicomponent Na+:H+ antiporter subunit G